MSAQQTRTRRPAQHQDQSRRSAAANGSGERRSRRWLFLGPPPRALAISGWALLPLRAFLGFTFCFAGLQKLANPNFFNANSPSSIQAQMIAAARLSPVHLLIGHLLRFAEPLGVLIAFGELAVGLGTLLGLWTRIAAVGGAVLSFTLFLTVSFHASPYFTGADIVFFFAWIPLILAGSGGVLSLDTVIASWTRHEARLAPPTLVPVRFALVQEICGHYDRGRCKARRGAPCDVAPCPFLHERVPDPVDDRAAQVDRRALVLGGAAAGATAVAAIVGAGTAAGLGRAIGLAKPPTSPGTVNLPLPGGAKSSTKTPQAAPAPTSTSSPPTTAAPQAAAPTSPPATSPPTTSPPATTSPTTAPTPSGTAIGPAADVPVGGAARFQDPASGDPAIVLQPSRGSFVAFDAVCPHAGCTVGYAAGAGLLVCPCHGSEFNPSSGAAESGPSPTGLRSISVALGGDGQLYADA